MLATHLESFWWPPAPENNIDPHFYSVHVYICFVFCFEINDLSYPIQTEIENLHDNKCLS